MDETIGRVEPTLRERAVDLALDGPQAHLSGVGDLLGCRAGGQSLEQGLAIGCLRLPPRLGGLSLLGAFGRRFEVVGHGRVPSRSGPPPPRGTTNVTIRIIAGMSRTKKEQT